MRVSFAGTQFLVATVMLLHTHSGYDVVFDQLCPMRPPIV